MIFQYNTYYASYSSVTLEMGIVSLELYRFNKKYIKKRYNYCDSNFGGFYPHSQIRHKNISVFKKSVGICYKPRVIKQKPGLIFYKDLHTFQNFQLYDIFYQQGCWTRSNLLSRTLWGSSRRQRQVRRGCTRTKITNPVVIRKAVLLRVHGVRGMPLWLLPMQDQLWDLWDSSCTELCRVQILRL